MATLQSFPCSSSASLKEIRCTLNSRKIQPSDFFFPKLPVDRQNGLSTLTTTFTDVNLMSKIETKTTNGRDQEVSNSEAKQELYAILEIVADRVEMHKNIGAQRDNWNHLLLSSINGITATAAIMAALAAVKGVGETLLVLKLSSTVLYMAATGILVVMNKIQPSQLAEEQRNASRLFKQLYEEIRTTLSLRKPISDDVNDAMQKVLALDKAYPLPLLGVMLDKFPAKVEPAVWWPQGQFKPKHEMFGRGKGKINGWNDNLEAEMKEIEGLVRRKDTAEYVRLSKVALKVNKVLAISGPLLTGLAAIGSVFLGSSVFGSWPVVFGVMSGALAAVVNTLEHGWQVGMVFEMYRSSAGFYKHMEETIESTLEDAATDVRENGELFEVKTALQLGRSLSELRDLASALSLSSELEQAQEEFASKLF
ncbi:hypothetical protein TIFTF001_051213 [Ficus carica]|uniref:F-box protein n=1 Tax=Ficus carica TaxID=3494 RepID=A0AA87Z038_FICCA|nr:hypothetical protein TIFTF001_051213 [Ficus carica]